MEQASGLGFSRLQASTVADNPASQRVLRKLGFGLVETGITEKPKHGPAREVHRSTASFRVRNSLNPNPPKEGVGLAS